MGLRNSRSYQEKLSEAKELMNRSLFKSAISILEQLEEKFPFQSSAFEIHSLTLLRNKRYFDAAYIATKGLNSSPEAGSLKRHLAEALSHIPGEEPRAEKYFIELMKDFSKDIKFLSTYADFLVRSDQFIEARKIYNSILARLISPKRRSRTLNDLARSYRFDHQPEKALEVLEKEPYSDDIYWIREKISCCVDLGRTENLLDLIKDARSKISQIQGRAVTSFLANLEVLEASVNALNGEWKKSIIWLMQQKVNINNKIKIWHAARRAIRGSGEYQQAIEFLLEQLEQHKSNLEIGYELNRFIADCNLDAASKEKYIETALVISPQNACILEMAAEYNYEGKAGSFWNRAWDEIIKTEGNDKLMLLNIADGYSKFLRHENSFSDALVIIDQAMSLAGYDWDLELERAICLARTNNQKDASEILRNLDKSRPDNPIVLDQLGICLRTLGLLEEALDVYKRKRLLQDDVPGLQGLGRTLYELGQTDEAIKIFEIVLERDSNDAEAKLHLATALLEKGEEVERAQKLFAELTPSDLAKRGREFFTAEKKIAELNRNLVEKEAEIEQSQKLAYLGTMATATAHELNQPIGIIRAIADAALSDLSIGLYSLEETKPILEKILHQTTRLANIIDNLRAFARNDRTRREPVNLNNLIEQVVQMFSEQFKHRNIQLIVDIRHKDQPPITWANPVQLEEVLINLLSNARDAVEGKKNAIVTVSCWRRKKGGCGFAVEDNGPGLSAEYKQKIYTPFVSTKPTEKGTGLGLFVSRKLISDLSGRLFFEDRKKGYGAKFIVYLPAIKGEEELK